MDVYTFELAKILISKFPNKKSYIFVRNTKTTRRGLLPLSGVILDAAAMEIDADSRSTPTFALLLFTFFCPIFHTIFLFKFKFFFSHIFYPLLKLSFSILGVFFTPIFALLVLLAGL